MEVSYFGSNQRFDLMKPLILVFGNWCIEIAVWSEKFILKKVLGRAYLVRIQKTN